MSDSITKARNLITEDREEQEAELDKVRAEQETELAEFRAKQEAEVSDLIERIDQLKAAEENLGSLNGAKAPVSSPPDKTRGRSRSTPAPASTPPRGTPARRARADHRASRDKVAAWIRENPGKGATEIAKACGIKKGTIIGILNRLAQETRIRRDDDPEDGRRKLYFAMEAPALPADDDGAKSEQERKIVECLREATGPLPPNEISMRTGIRSDHVPSMCQAMTTRQVISRVPPKREGLPPRYQPVRKLDDAIADAIA